MWFFWLLVGLSALVTWLVQARAQRMLAAARAWPTVEGRVVKTVMEQPGWQSIPRVSYAYVVDGQGHACDRMRPGGTPFYYSKRKAQAVLDALPPGRPVTVHYDPRKPARAVIELEPLSYGFRIALATTVLMAVFALIFSLLPPPSG